MEQPTVTRAERLRMQLRDEIVAAATESFARQGYHRTGMSEIAGSVGIGQSSLYGIFPGKRVLFDAVVDDAMGRILALLTAENGPEAADTFDAYREQATRIAVGFTAVLEHDPTMVQLLRTLLVEAHGVDDEIAEKARAFSEATAHLTAAYLRHGVERGYLRADLDVDGTARVVNGLIISVALEQDRRAASREDSERLVAATLRLYLEGVVARPSPPRTTIRPAAP